MTNRFSNVILGDRFVCLFELPAVMLVRNIFCLFLCIIISACNTTPESEVVFEPDYIYQAGNEGYACFRIPALITTNEGSLLAFAEGRKHGCSDTGDIDLVLKRSEDNGKTCRSLQVLPLSSGA